ncbi:isochorismatase family protein [Streptacidiphilus sp. EB129]|uniref:isochorismatase family protein n=1 Tax=Streptacidiphilus sp. EB129 TaxID=3156262 RepID=UPI0035110E95
MTPPPATAVTAATALLVIDAQRNMLQLDAPIPAATTVTQALDALLARARAAGATVVFIRNNGGEDDPDRPGTEGWELVHQPGAGEHVVDKSRQNSFAGTALGELLPPGTALVLAGMQSEYCVRATALAALSRGHRVTLAAGAHGTYPGEQSAETTAQAVELELSAAGATIAPVEEIAFR